MQTRRDIPDKLQRTSAVTDPEQGMQLSHIRGFNALINFDPQALQRQAILHYVIPV